MNLYTEQQMRDAIKMARNGARSEDNIIGSLNFIKPPIELPSDEEIGQEFKHGSDNWEVRQALEVGAKWMRNKMGGSNG